MEIYSWKFVCVVCALLLNATGSLSQLDVCGRPPLNTKIVGGANAAPGSWPWQVSIRFQGLHNCGGSLINKDWVLSGAQCLQGIGASFVKIHLDAGNGITEEKSILRFIIHEHYNSRTFDNDIALVQLSSSVTFSNYVMPVCLAASNSKFSAGTNVWVTGWGRTSTNNQQLPKTLQEVQLPIVSNKECDKIYGSITDNMICAGLAKGGKDICMGDAGGPMVAKQNGTWIQGGIVSFLSTKGCAVAGIPGGYTRLSRYQEWIKNKISNNQPGFVTYSNGNHGSPSLFCLLLSFSIIPFILSL